MEAEVKKLRTIAVDPVVYDKLKDLAREENRSLKNYLETLAGQLWEGLSDEK